MYFFSRSFTALTRLSPSLIVCSNEQNSFAMQATP